MSLPDQVMSGLEDTSGGMATDTSGWQDVGLVRHVSVSFGCNPVMSRAEAPGCFTRDIGASKKQLSVGLSIDGPRELHDTYRLDRTQRGTFDKVMRVGSTCANTESNSTYFARSMLRTRNTVAPFIASSATRWGRSECSSSPSSSAPPNRQSTLPTWDEASSPTASVCSALPVTPGLSLCPFECQTQFVFRIVCLLGPRRS